MSTVEEDFGDKAWVGVATTSIPCDMPGCPSHRRFKPADLARHKAMAHGVYSTSEQAKRNRANRNAPRTPQLVLCCHDCDWKVTLAETEWPAFALYQHTTSDHGRRPTDAERIPREERT